MSSLQPSTVGHREGGHLPDDLDGLLRTFFRAEMPEPWPVLEPPAPAVGSSTPRRRLFARSRLALAASLALLLIGQLSLSGTWQEMTSFVPGSGEGGTASREVRMRPKLYKPQPSRASSPAEGDWLPEHEKQPR